MAEKVKFWLDGRREVSLDREDVDLARLFLQEGRTTIGTAKEFRESGYSLTDAVAIANCAAQELEADRRR